MSGISAIYILDHKGRVMISRSYKGDVSSNVYESFNKKMLEYDEGTSNPVIEDGIGNIFFFKRVKNIIFLLVSKRNSNAILAYSFLYKLIDVFREYFKEIEEESIKDNFVVIYELLDEMMDNGYPQYTEVKVLSEFIKCERHEMVKEKKQSLEMSMPSAMTDTVSWRKLGIVYKKNECYLDVIEKVNMVVNSAGQVIKCEVIGNIMMKSQLSGMPELKLGLNDKAMYEIQGKAANKRAIDMNDLRFHQCVRLNKFENERMITFVPPDGEFELVSYRIESVLKPLFVLEVILNTLTHSRVDLTVKIQSNFKEKCLANNINIFVPVPTDIQSPVFKCMIGSASYCSERDSIQWTIPQFAGHKNYSMTASCSLPSLESKDRLNFTRIPAEIVFEIPFFTVSGIQVKYLKIQEKSGYQSFPWVRYLSKNGEYLVRMNLDGVKYSK